MEKFERRRRRGGGGEGVGRIEGGDDKREEGGAVEVALCFDEHIMTSLSHRWWRPSAPWR